MNAVYASTYGVANMSKSYCKSRDIDYKIPTLISTSITNIAMISYKDREFSRWITGYANKFPLKTYLLFGIRDTITIFSSFIAKNMIYNDSKDLHTFTGAVSTMTLPLGAQILSTPLHILAIDLYNRPGEPALSRWYNIKNLYYKVCLGRMARVLPAFGIGSWINDYLILRRQN